MSSRHDFREIPCIDISPLLAGGSEDQKRVGADMGRAAREVGFLYVTGHGIPGAVFDGLLSATRRFFARPLDEKMRVYIGGSRNHRGYVPEGEENFYGGAKDRKEAFDLSMDLPADDPDYLAGNPLLGPNQWPDGLPGFRENVMRYYERTFAVGRVVLRGFALGLGLPPDFFDPYVTKPPSQLRLIHYPHDPAAADDTGLGAHTDYECFTLLHATSPGLEVLNGAGEWIDAPPVPGAFVVNVGDMMEVWTNGEFVATSHRVRRVQEERYSFPLFFAVDYHTRVSPLPRFVDRNGRAPRELVAGEHLFAQTAQSFNYLKERVRRGEVAMPENALGLASFGQHARRTTAPGS